MSSTEEDNMSIGTPPELQEEARLVMGNLLPVKSAEKYLKVYDNFTGWQVTKKTNSFSETVMLAYFSELAKDKKPSTLWAMYSMLKSTIQMKHNINMKSYTNLATFLKRQSAGFKSKKSKILTDGNITKFLNEAPDNIFLVTKVALILGVNGACRMMELTNLTTNDVTCHDDIMLVKLHETKTKIDRTFVVGQEFVPLIKKYQALRPNTIKSDRFFINFKNGKCTNQVIGRHKLALMPTQIATYLDLPDSQCYTGHCFRRSSATLLADSGANLTTLKRHGGWKSGVVAESYIEDSVQNKRNISDRISETINMHTTPCHLSDPQPSTSRHNIIPSPEPPSSTSNIQRSPLPPCSTQTSKTENIQHTNINVPGKTITLNITNCPNMSNISINFN